jgi:hypothetical protein
MAISLTVPSSHTTLPSQATAPSPLQSSETNPIITSKAATVSKAKLKQRNRKANEFVIEFPLILTIEAATTYNLSGFTPDADLDVWVASDVVHSFKGKSGSTTKVTFRRALNDY